jgi:hypothetical protein
MQWRVVDDAEWSPVCKRHLIRFVWRCCAPVPAPVLGNRAVGKCEHNVWRWFCGSHQALARGAGRNGGSITFFQKSPHATFLTENNADVLLELKLPQTWPYRAER